MSTLLSRSRACVSVRPMTPSSGSENTAVDEFSKTTVENIYAVGREHDKVHYDLFVIGQFDVVAVLHLLDRCHGLFGYDLYSTPYPVSYTHLRAHETDSY